MIRNPGFLIHYKSYLSIANLRKKDNTKQKSLQICEKIYEKNTF
jgi:hypothetical protein